MSDAENAGSATIDRPFRFRRRPIAIAPDFRIDWKITLLLFILEISSRGGKSSLKRLHVINWAVRTAKHQDAFERTTGSDAPLFAFKVRFEPAFSRAIEFAEAQELIEWVEGDRVKITNKGRTYIKAVQKKGDVMGPERSFLERLGKSLTEPKATELISGARIA